MNAMHNAPASDPSLVYPSPLKEFWQAFAHNKGALGGLLFMLLIVFCALFAPWVAPYDPSEQFRDFLLTPPSWLEGGQARFLLGTDELGRDLLSRLIHGARLSLLIGLSSVVISLIPGILLGLLAGFSPNRAGPLIMRLMDIMLALPSLLLAVAIVAILGPGLINTVIAIAIVSLPAYVRLTRAAVMTELNRDYVTASRLAGAGTLRLMFVCVLPNCMAPLIVQATLSFSSAILDAAALGFLGLGVQPPTPEWGTMLASARDYIERAWWVVSLPGLTILLSVLAINLMGDGLRDAPGWVSADHLRFDGHDMLTLKGRQRRRIVGKDMAMVFQDPMTALNPSYTVGYQIEEVLRLHLGLRGKALRQRALELLERVEIPAAASRLDAYPHQLSGGMSQRVAIAMAIAAEPKLLIADEPTTALDVTIQAQIMELLLNLQRDQDMALILITHDLAVVAETAQRVCVMYAGEAVEIGGVPALFDRPTHPYTEALIKAIPEHCAGEARLATLPGIVPGRYDRPRGCLLSPRCPYAQEHCRQERPALEAHERGAVRCFYPLNLLNEVA